MWPCDGDMWPCGGAKRASPSRSWWSVPAGRQNGSSTVRAQTDAPKTRTPPSTNSVDERHIGRASARREQLGDPVIAMLGACRDWRVVCRVVGTAQGGWGLGPSQPSRVADSASGPGPALGRPGRRSLRRVSVRAGSARVRRRLCGPGRRRLCGPGRQGSGRPRLSSSGQPGPSGVRATPAVVVRATPAVVCACPAVGRWCAAVGLLWSARC